MRNGQNERFQILRNGKDFVLDSLENACSLIEESLNNKYAPKETNGLPLTFSWNPIRVFVSSHAKDSSGKIDDIWVDVYSSLKIANEARQMLMEKGFSAKEVIN